MSRLALLCPPVLSWHVLGTFLWAAGLCGASFLSIYLIVEFFDRFDTFLNYGASSGPGPIRTPSTMIGKT